jgi:hypothetical protein
MKARQLGDFQTPPELVAQILRILGPIGKKWERVLEPTCGRGNFIRGLLESASPPQEIVGIEIQDKYLPEARSIASPKVTIISGDIFKLNLKTDLKWKSKGALLAVGNPPWVTNAEIGSLDGTNLPPKSNFKRLRGLEARMGHSNFDIAEFIWIKLIEELAKDQATIALLCKTSVARSLIGYARQFRLPLGCLQLRSIDAKRWFGVAVEASLFSLQTGCSHPHYEAEILHSLDAASPSTILGFAKGNLVADLKSYQAVSFLEGTSPWQWRQGVKHDAAPALELTWEDDHWLNARGEKAEVEEEFIFPLLKGSDLHSYHGQKNLKRAVIIPQTRIDQDTKLLRKRAPKLWRYLSEHENLFLKRKSSIYRDKPPFSIFGIGDYSFSTYKVMVSGLYKDPRFIAIGPINSKPVLCDDTCYLLPGDSATQSAVIAAILNHPLAQKFIKSISFRDAKRPITKAVLRRINLLELAKRIPLQEVRDKIMLTLNGIQTYQEQGPQLTNNLVEALELDRQAFQPNMFGH